MSKIIETNTGETKSLVSIDHPSNLNLTICKNPFSSIQSHLEIIEGGNLIDICKFANIDPSFVHIYINDKYIKRENYFDIYPKSKDIITIRVFLGGGDDSNGQSKNPWRTLAQIVVTVVAAYVGGPWGATIFLAGNLAINALIPIPKAKIDELGFNTNNTYAIVGTRNQSLPFGTVPRILGRARIWPPRASAPYTEIIGDAQYVNEIYCLGPGPLDKSDMKIGETSTDNFQGFSYEFLVGNQQTSQIFPTTVIQKDLSIKFENMTYPWGAIFWPLFSGNYVIQTTEIDTKRIQLDFIAPNGLVYFSRDKQERSTLIKSLHIEIYYNSSWVNVFAFNNASLENATETTLFNIESPDHDLSYFTMTGNSNDLIRSSITWEMPVADRYNIRISVSFLHITPGDGYQQYVESKGRTYEDIYWTAIKSTIESNEDVSPVQPENSSIEYVAIKVKATEQLNGTIDTFNIVCQAHHPTYDGTNWVVKATRNPAWCYATVLTDSSNKRALSYSRLNGDNLLSFAQECESKGFECNGVLTSKAPSKEILKQIAAVGRATVGMPGEKHGVVRDLIQSTPIQVFSPRNSWSYSAKKIFSNIPHGIRCKFIDENGQPDEIIAYDDGYDVSNATDIEGIDFALVNNATQAWKLGRSYLAVARLRPEVHQINVDFEHIVCTRGDLVGLSHDAPSIGLGWARIQSIDIDGTNVTIVLDDIVTQTPGTDYGILIRTNTIPVSCAIDSAPGSSYEITCTLPAASSSLIAVDNLLVWGELNNEYAEMIVKEIIPSSDLTATIYLVDYSPGIHNADSGTIPDWDSHITLPVNISIYPPPTPVIKTIISDESAMIVDPNGNLVSRMLVYFETPTVTGNNQPVKVEIQYRVIENSNTAPIWEANTAYALGDRVRPSRKADLLLELKRSYLDLNSNIPSLDLNGNIDLFIKQSLNHVYYTKTECENHGNIILDVNDSNIYNYVKNLNLSYRSYWFECVQAGTSDSSAPDWTADLTTTIDDGTVKWLVIGSSSLLSQWQTVTNVDFNNGNFSLFPVESGKNYEIRLRYWSSQGIPGDWISTTHVIVGGTNPPGTPTGLSSDPWMNGLRFYWDEAPEIDFSYWTYRIQVESEGWSAWQQTTTPQVYKFLDSTQSEAYKPAATIYIEVIAYDQAGNYSPTASYNNDTGNLYIPSTSLDDFAQISAAFYEVPVLRDFVWASNDPGAGSISWSAGSLFFNGTEYSITGNNSATHWIYWDPNGTTTIFVGTNDDSTIPEGSFVIAVNNSGTYALVWNNAAANQVIGSAWIKNAAIVTAKIADLAVTDAKINDLDASKIQAGTILITGFGSDLLGSINSPNVITDPNFAKRVNLGANFNYWITSGTVTFDGSYGENSTPGVRLNVSDASSISTPISVQVKNGEKWYFRGRIYLSSDFDASYLDVIISTYDKNKANVSQQSFTSTITKSAWTTIEGSVTINDSDAAYAAFTEYIANDGSNGYAYIEELYFSKIQPGATVGATWGTDLNSIPSYFGASAPDNSIAIDGTNIGIHATGSSWPIKLSANSGNGYLYAGNGSTIYIEFDGTNFNLQPSAMNLLAGRDFNLIGSDSDPGVINFVGTTYSVTMGGDVDGNRFSIVPSSGNVTTFDIGDSWWLGSNNFYSVNVLAYDTIHLYANIDASNFARTSIDSNGSSAYVSLHAKSGSGECRVDATANSSSFGPIGNKIIDCGYSSLAWDDVWADDFQNVADIPFLDEVDDLSLINNIKSSGIRDKRTGFLIIDDNTLPDWFMTKDKRTGTIALDSDGKPYIALKTHLGLHDGAFRQLISEQQDIHSMIEYLQTQLNELKKGE